MSSQPPLPTARRRAFLQFLAASPLLGAIGLSSGWWHAAVAAGRDPITAARDALDVFDFETVARKNLFPRTSDTWRPAPTMTGRYGRTARASSGISCGSGGRWTFGKIDTSASVLDTTWDTPCCPVSGRQPQGVPPGGESAVARAAKTSRPSWCSRPGHRLGRRRDRRARRARVVPTLSAQRLGPDAADDQACRGGRLPVARVHGGPAWRQQSCDRDARRAAATESCAGCHPKGRQRQ